MTHSKEVSDILLEIKNNTSNLINVMTCMKEKVSNEIIHGEYL